MLPRNLAGTDQFVRFVAGPAGEVHVRQHHAAILPRLLRSGVPGVSHRITGVEFRQAIEWSRQAGLRLEAGF